MDISVSNVAAAVSGPFFELTPPMKSPAATGTINVQLSHLTAVLGGSLFDVRVGRKAAEDKTLPVPIVVRADGCLFASLEMGTTPLFQLVGCDPTNAERCLMWSAGLNGNGYSGWSVVVEIPSEDGTGEPKRWDAAEWRQWSRERDGSSGRVGWAKPPTAGSLSTVRPADLELTNNPFDDGIGMKASLLPTAEE
jgi:hypothetical protein